MSARTTRAKFHCDGFDVNNDVIDSPKVYQFSAVTDDGTPENERYHRYTPGGSLQLAVDNPAVSFKPGDFYYLDITPADENV